MFAGVSRQEGAGPSEEQRGGQEHSPGLIKHSVLNHYPANFFFLYVGFLKTGIFGVTLSIRASAACH